MQAKLIFLQILRVSKKLYTCINSIFGHTKRTLYKTGDDKNRAYHDTPYFFILFYQYLGDAKIASNALRMA